MMATDKPIPLGKASILKSSPILIIRKSYETNWNQHLVDGWSLADGWDRFRNNYVGLPRYEPSKLFAPNFNHWTVSNWHDMMHVDPTNTWSLPSPLPLVQIIPAKIHWNSLRWSSSPYLPIKMIITALHLTLSIGSNKNDCHQKNTEETEKVKLHPVVSFINASSTVEGFSDCSFFPFILNIHKPWFSICPVHGLRSHCFRNCNRRRWDSVQNCCKISSFLLPNSNFLRAKFPKWLFHCECAV